MQLLDDPAAHAEEKNCPHKGATGIGQSCSKLPEAGSVAWSFLVG